jgi:hypothetical protein
VYEIKPSTLDAVGITHGAQRNQTLWVEDTLSFDRFAASASLRLFRSELPPAFSEVFQPLANFLFQSGALVFGDSSGQVELSRVRTECNFLHRHGVGPHKRSACFLVFISSL